MEEIKSSHYHKLYGEKRTRVCYRKSDFVDYFLMMLVCGLVVYFSFSPNIFMQASGLFLCALMVIFFIVRHGFELKTPLIARRPQDVLYMFIYQIQNMKMTYVLAVAILALENYLIYLTPELPHHVELMHEIALYLFFIHLFVITAYRSVILVAHLKKKEHVRKVLMDSSWKKMIAKREGISLEIYHAYFTGLLTHIILIAPWYLVIKYANFSVIFLPVICFINVIVNSKFRKVMNAWFYRDHWLGHNSELEFLYLHGTHHDAIPSGLIGVAGNGFLEGFSRHLMGFPLPFFNPVTASIFYTLRIKQDIDSHQYIPGVFPMQPRSFQEVTQHSMHHFGRLEPYSLAMKIDQAGISDEYKAAFKQLPEEFKNSIKLDEELTGYQWDSPAFRRYLALVDKYS